MYLEEKFSINLNKWKIVKCYNGTIKQAPPDRILVGNNKTTSPRSLTNITNKYFIDKINEIRRGFTWSQVKPKEILNELIPKFNIQFNLSPITLPELLKNIIK